MSAPATVLELLAERPADAGHGSAGLRRRPGRVGQDDARRRGRRRFRQARPGTWLAPPAHGRHVPRLVGSPARRRAARGAADSRWRRGGRAATAATTGWPAQFAETVARGAGAAAGARGRGQRSLPVRSAADGARLGGGAARPAHAPRHRARRRRLRAALGAVGRRRAGAVHPRAHPRARRCPRGRHRALREHGRVATAIRIEALPARLGDCLLVECLRPGAAPWRMLVDGGPSDTWPLLEARLAKLPKASRQIDVAVVTHVDSDHIGGFLPFVRSDFAHEQVARLLVQRTPAPRRRTQHRAGRGPRRRAAPARLGRSAPASSALEQRRTARSRSPPRRPSRRGLGAAGRAAHHACSRRTPNDSAPSRRPWASVLQEGARRRPARSAVPIARAQLGDLDTLAPSTARKDDSVPNGSSIGLLVEHRGASVVLAGGRVRRRARCRPQRRRAARGLERLEIDAFKLPHHGSRGNVLETMLATGAGPGTTCSPATATPSTTPTTPPWHARC